MASRASDAASRRPADTADEDSDRRPVSVSAVRKAVASFAELTQQSPERVTGIRPADGGWSVLVDVVEIERVPATMSVLATYRLDVDADGELLGYERLRRFARAATDQH